MVIFYYYYSMIFEISFTHTSPINTSRYYGSSHPPEHFLLNSRLCHNRNHSKYKKSLMPLLNNPRHHGLAAWSETGAEPEAVSASGTATTHTSPGPRALPGNGFDDLIYKSLDAKETEEHFILLLLCHWREQLPSSTIRGLSFFHFAYTMESHTKIICPCCQ